GIPNMHMRSAAQCAAGKRRADVSRVEIAWPRRRSVNVDNDPLAMERSVLPIRGWIFRAKDKGNFVFARMKCRDSAMCASLSAIQLTHYPGLNIDHFNGATIEFCTRCVSSGVEDNPLSIW